MSFLQSILLLRIKLLEKRIYRLNLYKQKTDTWLKEDKKLLKDLRGYYADSIIKGYPK